MFFPKKPRRAKLYSSSSSPSPSCSCFPVMAHSLSSLFSYTPHPLPSPKPNPNLYSLPPRSRSFTTAQNNQNLTSKPPNSEKKSFAIATGELFLGLASRLLKTSNRGFSEKFERFPVVETIKKVNGSKNFERIGVVMEDEIEPEVIWEQRVKDVEAEKERTIVTSPGFSFSAAGLLFPYHLGVAQFLIEKGYIKETTPLAGSSAGAIVCAVIASGASMQEALNATKILAEDCRARGTAFRLGSHLL
ncbi:hypothetical protein Pint_33322 [Pistacia integerrima]|uniref:Uncharacterized protein n=1 Tax=Pistacia integerrima TaxID=434235 RepID=A0ACC0X783_9ROSI|nr:hypothetical protein Pint_33322 [Pistacia integerrima]